MNYRPLRNILCGILTFIFCGASLAPQMAAASWKYTFGAGGAEPGAIAVKPGDSYTGSAGYGFDLNTTPTDDGAPFFFSVRLPEGTYQVSVKLGDARSASSNTIKAESRQLMLEQITTRAGEFVERSFLVNVRDSHLSSPPKNAPGGSAVLLNDREQGILRWDDKLTVEFDGPNPRLSALTIQSVSSPVVYLVGDSTVTDQPNEPGASWGQMLPRFLSGVAVANHAESGETMKSFLSELRLTKVLSQIKIGDYLFIQFAHNDEKKQWPQTYVEAGTTYKSYLRVFIAEARLRGAVPVLVTPMQRRIFDAQNKVQNSHGSYPQAMREVAAEERVALIDLERMSIAFYQALGPQRSALAFSGNGKDITHQNDYGAYEFAKCVVQGIRDAKLPLAQNITGDFQGFDPAQPDAPESFALPKSILHKSEAIRGN